MKSFTPEVSWHNRDPILSVDIQAKPLSSEPSDPIAYRLASCGNDRHVIIWQAELIPEDSPRAMRLVKLECLADLTRHETPVNVVRFSPNTTRDLLAAGDDGTIIIWALCSDDSMEVDEVSPKKNGNHQEGVNGEVRLSQDEMNPFEQDTEVIAKEQWKPMKVLRGHLQDVSDLNWSPDGQQLISASVDNTAIVWDVNKGQKLHTFSDHKGFVQGVCWDPLNKFWATLSADRNLRIYATHNRRTVNRVFKMSLDNDKSTRLFYDDTLRSFCRRLTFTPNGEFLLAPSGIFEMNDGQGAEDDFKYVNCTYVFERRSLNRPSFYLLSAKYTVAVRCCPRLFTLIEGLDNPYEFPYRIVFAVATQDSVLFYDSQQELPFAQVSQIHYLRLTDIAWSADGRLLIISSTDGFATFVRFEDDELGTTYDGPTFQEVVEEAPKEETPKKELTKIIAKTPEQTPEAEKNKKLGERPANNKSIKMFFKPKGELPTSPNCNGQEVAVANQQATSSAIRPVVDAPEESLPDVLPLAETCGVVMPATCGVKRKEVIDLTEDSGEAAPAPKTPKPAPTNNKQPRRIQLTTLSTSLNR